MYNLLLKYTKFKPKRLRPWHLIQLLNAEVLVFLFQLEVMGNKVLRTSVHRWFLCMYTCVHLIFTGLNKN